MKHIVYANNQRAQHVESGIFPTLMLACMVIITTNYPTSSTAWLLKNGDEKIVWGKEDSYSTVLEDNKLRVFGPTAAQLREQGERFVYRGEALRKNAKWIEGICERSENPEQFEDE